MCGNYCFFCLNAMFLQFCFWNGLSYAFFWEFLFNRKCHIFIYTYILILFRDFLRPGSYDVSPASYQLRNAFSTSHLHTSTIIPTNPRRRFVFALIILRVIVFFYFFLCLLSRLCIVQRLKLCLNCLCLSFYQFFCTK